MVIAPGLGSFSTLTFTVAPAGEIGCQAALQLGSLAWVLHHHFRPPSLAASRHVAVSNFKGARKYLSVYLK